MMPGKCARVLQCFEAPPGRGRLAAFSNADEGRLLRKKHPVGRALSIHGEPGEINPRGHRPPRGIAAVPDRRVHTAGEIPVHEIADLPAGDVIHREGRGSGCGEIER